VDVPAALHGGPGRLRAVADDVAGIVTILPRALYG